MFTEFFIFLDKIIFNKYFSFDCQGYYLRNTVFYFFNINILNLIKINFVEFITYENI